MGIAGIVCIVFAGLCGAEYLATSIQTDGLAVLKTSGVDANGSLVSRAMAMDEARITRTVSAENEMESELSVRSKGPVLFSEFASSKIPAPEIHEFCTFLLQFEQETSQESAQYASGVMQQGAIDLTHTVGPGISALTSVNGSGLLVLGSRNQENQSLTSHGFVSGNMSVSDLVRYGGRL
jgi:hypothetical protein